MVTNLPDGVQSAAAIFAVDWTMRRHQAPRPRLAFSQKGAAKQPAGELVFINSSQERCRQIILPASRYNAAMITQ